MKTMTDEKLKEAVRKSYGDIAKADDSSACWHPSSCCGAPPTAQQIAAALGYSKQELTGVPEGANMGLGCGNPQAIAALKPGETVLDLGSGGGFDCLLAAQAVGQKGKVIGVDMTPEMVSKAREHAAKGGYENVEFRLGEIENLPVQDNSVDVIISNCVINLSTDKERVYSEAFRVLKPGGRLAIMDIVVTAALPDEIRESFELYTGCVAGAQRVDFLEKIITKVGFKNISVRPRDESRALIRQWMPGSKIEDFIVSASIEATK